MTTYNPFSLKGKSILVTGASSGIGKATAVACSKMGAKVVITGRNELKLQETYSQLGDGCEQILADFDNETDFYNLINCLGNLDGVVHSAGIASTVPFKFVNRNKLKNIFDVNFFAPVFLMQQLLKKKKISDFASIVFLASIDGPITAHIGNSMYGATKAAICAMTKALAVELAVKNIRVNAILPGMIDTPLIHAGNISEEQLEKDKMTYPLRRYGRPDEIAHAAIYFLSGASTFTTGASLVVDGGFTLL